MSRPIDPGKGNIGAVGVHDPATRGAEGTVRPCTRTRRHLRRGAFTGKVYEPEPKAQKGDERSHNADNTEGNCKNQYTEWRINDSRKTPKMIPIRNPFLICKGLEGMS